MFGMMGGRNPFMPGINPMINMGIGSAAPQQQAPSGFAGIFYGLFEKIAKDMGNKMTDDILPKNITDEEKLSVLDQYRSSLQVTPNEGSPDWFANALQSGLKQGMMTKYASIRESGASPYVNVNNKFGMGKDFVEMEKRRQQKLIDERMGYVSKQ